MKRKLASPIGIRLQAALELLRCLQRRSGIAEEDQVQL